MTNGSRSNNGYKVIGTRPIRHDGYDKVTGKALYGADFSMSGLLFGKILRSPHAHAKIINIDTSAVENLEGVKAVVTSKDLSQKNWTKEKDAIMAKDKVLYKGHPIAGVAAINHHIAEEALKLIKVDYEILPAVLTAPEGLDSSAPLIDETKKNNISNHVKHELGNIEEGFKKSDIIVERTFDTATVHQGYIEPHNATVDWNQDKKINIWVSTQSAFDIRGRTAEILDLNPSDVKTTPMEIGGGFGAKFDPYACPIAALLSKKTGRPVKIVHTRKEEFESTGPTPGSNVKVKIGATKEGKILAAEATLAYEDGAFPGGVVSAGALCAFATYDIENVLINGYDVLVNKPATAAYRAPGATNSNVVTETVIDEIAEKLEMDPIEFRLLNASKEGVRRADGPKHPSIGVIEVLNAMKNHPHYNEPLSESANINRGIAIGFWMNGAGPSSINLSVHPDGRINLIEGSTDIGGSRASISMMVAEVLGVQAEDIKPSVVDTDKIGFTSGTGGSSVTYKAGVAGHIAATNLKQSLIERASSIWGVPSDTVSMENGILFSTKDKSLSITLKDLAKDLNDTGGPIISNGAINPSGAAPSISGHIIDVKVDPETGKIDVVKCTIFQDVGRAIHPSYVEGQMQGGTVQGIGWALNEEYFYNEDSYEMANPTFLDYRMPLALDLPMIDTEIIEVPNPAHPFGVRGVGEASITSPPAAIANAIYRITGVRVNQLPIKPNLLLESIKK